ncbi:MAG: A24 family peptidase [Acidimicrobiales bacterium]
MWRVLQGRLAELDSDVERATAALYRRPLPPARRQLGARSPAGPWPGWAAPVSWDRLALAVAPPRWRAATATSLVAVEGGLAWTPALPATLFLGAVLTVAAVVDARTSRVPNALVLPAHPAGLVLFAVAAGIDGQRWPLAGAVLAMAGVLLGWAAALVAVVVLGRGPTRRRGAIPAVPWLWLGALIVLLVAR